ncbi:hypothetical protein TNIN_195821 [Trichonephila inaurata madagascariensis]|uniref:Uncharacterized protein n=1 Tax=Trichonephila inaurata madagascariensis TaxID=2747483 RepID=A0A8X6YBE3_9ARAC|nr:hypothetical protein TNIN_195821 [Trichonephila inaurata madagascariensis]
MGMLINDDIDPIMNENCEEKCIIFEKVEELNNDFIKRNARVRQMKKFSFNTSVLGKDKITNMDQNPNDLMLLPWKKKNTYLDTMYKKKGCSVCIPKNC